MRLLQAGLAVTAIAWVVMSFTYPFGWDQGLFSSVGGEIVRGGLPYVHAWDLKGPLVYYGYAAAEGLFGVHLWSIRILDATLLVASALALGRVAAVVTGQAVARFTALLYILWYASHSFWHTAQPDGWTGMLLVIGLAPMLARWRGGNVWYMAIAGLCIGAITLLKPVYALFLLLPVLHIVTTGPSAFVASFAAVLAGWLVPVGVTAIWFAMQGGLRELIAVHLQYSAFYVSRGPGNPLTGLTEYFLSVSVITLALPAAVYGAMRLWQRSRPVAIMLVCWVAVAVLAVVVQNRFYAYHWLPLLPAVTILAVVGLHEMWLRTRALAAVFGAALLLRCLAPIGLEEFRFASWMLERIDRQAYYDAYGEPGDDMKAVWWLTQSGKPGDVFIFGWHCGIDWLSGRHAVSRFRYSLPLMLSEEPIRSEYRAELLDSLRTTPPQYIVVTPQSEEIIGRAMTIDDFPELASLVRGNYHVVAQLGTITIHELTR